MNNGVMENNVCILVVFIYWESFHVSYTSVSWREVTDPSVILIYFIKTCVSVFCIQD